VLIPWCCGNQRQLSKSCGTALKSAFAENRGPITAYVVINDGDTLHWHISIYLGLSWSLDIAPNPPLLKPLKRVFWLIYLPWMVQETATYNAADLHSAVVRHLANKPSLMSQ